MNNQIMELIKALVGRLAKGEIDEIVNRKENGRLTRNEIIYALEDYPGDISSPPLDSFDGAIEYDIFDEELEARKIEFLLWFDDEESDLTLSLDVRKSNSGVFVISIDDIRVQ